MRYRLRRTRDHAGAGLFGLGLARDHRLVGQSGSVRHEGVERRRPGRRAMARLRDCEGQFLEVDPPRKLVQTWHMAGAPGTPSTVTYLLQPIAGGTRLTVHHSGIAAPDQRSNIGAGWRTSFDRLSEILSTDPE